MVVLTLALSLLVVLPQLPTLWAEPRVAATAPAHHLRNGFRNLDPQYSYPVLDRARRFFQRGFEGWPARGVAPAVVPNDGAVVRNNGEHPTVTWVGHATLLVQLDGLNILTDPHWGERASPVGFAGPRRLVAPGMRFEDLPPIHAVVISHDHYDHLDVDTVERLARAHRPTFFVPLGIKEWLGDRGVRNVVELDWWQSRVFRGVTFVATPAQHSSGRGLHDQNQRLWSSWVMLGQTRRFFFAGDTGYTPSMKEIGKRYGPFDVAAIPIGGYSAWSERHPNHVNPEEAVQLFEDVRGRLLVPVHWGTFELNREPFREPPDRLMAAALARGLEERMALLTPGQLVHW
ncbi:MAG: MBL fold metallo-hydrolase [Candidatus Rokuibacteriota bacterium]